MTFGFLRVTTFGFFLATFFFVAGFTGAIFTGAASVALRLGPVGAVARDSYY